MQAPREPPSLNPSVGSAQSLGRRHLHQAHPTLKPYITPWRAWGLSESAPDDQEGAFLRRSPVRWLRGCGAPKRGGDGSMRPGWYPVSGPPGGKAQGTLFVEVLGMSTCWTPCLVHLAGPRCRPTRNTTTNSPPWNPVLLPQALVTNLDILLKA